MLDSMMVRRYENKFYLCIVLINVSQVKYSELEKKLKAAGCRLVRNSRHPIWYSQITGKEFQMSHHRNEEVRPGTLKDIIKNSGINTV